jgi:hypothetical protein
VLNGLGALFIRESAVRSSLEKQLGLGLCSKKMSVSPLPLELGEIKSKREKSAFYIFPDSVT